MAPGGAHPRCALGGRGSGPLPRQLPGGSRNSGLGGRAALGQPRPGDRAVGDISQPAPQADLPEKEGRRPGGLWPNRLGPESGPLATACEGTSQCFPPTRAGSPTLWASRRRPCTTPRGRAPGGAEDLGPRPLRGAAACVERAGLLRLARRRQGPACRATPPFSSGLESPIGGSLQARACLAIAVPPEGGFGGSPSRPVAAAPFSSVRHVALA